jgi:hypothetical protein
MEPGGEISPGDFLNTFLNALARTNAEVIAGLFNL